MTLEDFQALKVAVEDAKSERDRLAGMAEQAEKALKAEFGVTGKAAEKLLAKLEKDAAKLEADFDRELKTWRKKWGGKIDGD